MTSDLPAESAVTSTPLDRPRHSEAVIHRRRTRCRACDGTGLRAFLSLGPQPLANAFLSGEDDVDDERFFPLDVYCCDACGLVQLLDVVDPEALFGNYIYASGVSETMAAHFRDYARSVTETLSFVDETLGAVQRAAWQLRGMADEAAEKWGSAALT